MDKLKNEKRLISPNKISLPVYDKENGILDEYIQTTDKACQENFTCCICACLAWDPVCCPKCDKPFCRACLAKYGKNKICPFKCEINSFREITRNEKNYLNKIKIKCTNVGCSKYIPYTEYVKHLEKCSLRKYHCKNYPCKEEGYIKEMNKHSKICPHRIVECSKCKQNIKFCEMKVHQQEHCPEIMVKCKFCKCSMKRGIYLKEHLSENNENAKCLKAQVDRWSQMYNEDVNNKNNEINELKNKVKEMEKKQKTYEIENIKLKKNLEEIKYIFKKTYNKFFIAENEKVLENIVNIKSNKKKEGENHSNKENICPNNDINLKSKTKRYTYNNNENYINSNSFNERRIEKFELGNKKDNKKEKMPCRLLQSGKKETSIYTYYKNLHSLLNK